MNRYSRLMIAICEYVPASFHAAIWVILIFDRQEPASRNLRKQNTKLQINISFSLKPQIFY